MALNKEKLAVDLENAFKIAQNNPSPTSQTDIAQAIATAIHTYYIGATVNTLIDVGVANGGVNASIPPPSGPTSYCGSPPYRGAYRSLSKNDAPGDIAISRN